MAKLNRNMFNLSHEVKMSTKFGLLTPFICKPILPGDSFRVNSEVMARMAPMVFPVMHRVNLYVHYFYVPYRLLWDKFEDWVSGGEDGLQQPTFPYVKYNSANINDFKTGTLADYLGFPVWDRTKTAPAVGANSLEINAMPFKAYQKIYNDWFRDQDLVTKNQVGSNIDGDQQTIHANLVKLQNRPFEPDYFTTARPNAQKGNVVNYLGQRERWLQTQSGDFPPISAGNDILRFVDSGSSTSRVRHSEGSTGYVNLYGTINDLRRANSIQQFQEAMQRTGGRFIEYLKGIWQVRSSDARLQNAEYLGGNKQPLTISEVLSGTNTTAAGGGADSVVGDLYGHGISIGNKNGFSRSFEEHGILMGIVSIIPRTGYNEGLKRWWARIGDKFEIPVPHLANIGEQALENRELWFDHTDPNSTAMQNTFGYQDRYGDYKYACDEARGDMRFQLDRWHLTRQINASINLNQNFVECSADRENINRIFNVTDPTLDTFWLQIYNKIDAVRKLPYTAIPELS